MKITFVQTGGTIDKDYPKSTKGWAFEIDTPAVERIIPKLNPTFDYEIISVLKKDSMEITDDDRLLLRGRCDTLDCDKIIITHGTDTMGDTASALMNIERKTVVITGAMRPERFSNSDADINLGMAIAAVQTLDQGVYICMHGRVIPAEKVDRNMQT
eukprot:CAMPEP_0197436988 /NCGR_PEP_ID=MMETSP1175-20131217/4311_1 /TAXON_ID=1003142 /ORGANISM="Triceratium dubium, Strain CCMP147" /LENGTH=156 /DNA_ID=CAMNT_0042966397 /DNA_START=38 /DNA_END=504 /DNA_ORIENTATION=+